MFKSIAMLLCACVGVGIAIFGFLIIFNVCEIPPQSFRGLALITLGALYANSCVLLSKD